MNKPEVAHYLKLAGVPAKHTAKLLEVSVSRVSQLVKEYTPGAPGCDQDGGDPVKAWQVARARKTEIEAEHRALLLDRARGDLIPQSEVREVFSRVFAAYRQATREIDRRYGPEAAAILIQAERSALRVQSEEPCLEQN